MCVQLCPALSDLIDYSPPGSSVKGFPRQEYWSGLPYSPPGNLPNLRIEPASPVSPALKADSSLLSHREAGLQSIRLQRGGHAWAHTHTPFYKWRNWGSELGVWLGERHSFLYKLTHIFHFLLNNHCIKQLNNVCHLNAMVLYRIQKEEKRCVWTNRHL